MRLNHVARVPILTVAIGMCLMLGFTRTAQAEQSANGIATATTTVYPAIAIATNQNLAFNGGVAGDPAKVVATSDTVDSAKFTVTGGTSAAYNITLPVSVTMITGAGGANQTIVVNTFTSSIGASGNTGAGASQSFYVGATRAALGAAQVQGAYTANFTVTVQYQ